MEDLRSAVTRDFASILVAPDSDEPGVTRSMLRRPLEKLDLGNKERMQPAAHTLFRVGEIFSPVPFTAFRQIFKGASRDLELLEMRQQEQAGCCREPGSNPAGIDEIAP